MIEPLILLKWGNNSLKAIQAERSIADRNAFLGDPDFVKIPVKELIRLHQNRMSDFSFAQPQNHP
jgi:gamma-glutamyltranspeptidase/glutathione hydrolase